MKFLRVLSRLAILLAVAAIFIGWTEWHYARSGSPALPAAIANGIGTPGFAKWSNEKRHQPSAPNLGYISDFAAYALSCALLALTGRVLFRLRLNPRPSSEGKPILLDLRRAAIPPGTPHFPKHQIDPGPLANT